MKKIIYDDNFIDSSSNVFIALLEKTEWKSNLLSELYKKLCFPNYFGFNWDALLDCMRDF
jgi:RNAse (barnase) inhibitor barstar